MNYDAYVITCLTNMHAGSGDTTFGVVDKLVQRDPVTTYPTIHSPSLKGALREHFNGMEETFSTAVFGSKNPSGPQQQGIYRFFPGNLMALPVRSSTQTFFMATTPSLIGSFLRTLDQFDIQINAPAFKIIEDLKPEKGTAMIGEAMEETDIEDFKGRPDPSLKDLDTFLGSRLAVFHESDFKEISTYLPVIARNNLENGESKNLWYEEIIPHETRFFCIIGKGEEHADVFDAALKADIVQIGANASIGYGYTHIRKLNGKGGIDG